MCTEGACLFPHPQVTEVAVVGAPAWATVRGEPRGLSCLVSVEVMSS